MGADLMMQLLPYTVFPCAGYIAMAVEAISQIHHEDDDALAIAGYSLRNLSINFALQVPDDDKGIETVFNLHAAGSKSSRWFDFTISSVIADTNTWTEHCSGLISVETSRKGQSI